MSAWKAAPPNDCRITLRCLKQTFEFSFRPGTDFSTLRSENSLIDRFFDQREGDEHGGEKGERVVQITSRPCFKLSSGRMRGATWFDRTRPPQGIVWLLGAEMHDDRHKGKSDAYDLLAALDANGTLFPTELDYKLLELDRRRWDTSSFADDLRSDADALVEGVLARGDTRFRVVNVPVRVATHREDGMLAVYVAVSTRPVTGPRSGLDFPLTPERFLLIQEGVREALERRLGKEVLAGEWQDMSVFGGGAKQERAFIVLTEIAS
jgi:hypothetical protein